MPAYTYNLESQNTLYYPNQIHSPGMILYPYQQIEKPKPLHHTRYVTQFPILINERMDIQGPTQSEVPEKNRNSDNLLSNENAGIALENSEPPLK